MFPFIKFKKEKVDEASHDCESIISFDKITNDIYTYGIIYIEKYIDPHELVEIVNNTLNVKEQVLIMKLIANSTQNNLIN